MTGTPPAQHSDITQTMNTSLTQSRDITDISPKHRRDETNTWLTHHSNQTDTSLTQTWDITETSLTHHRNKTETSQKTSPTHHWNIAETHLKRHRDVAATFPDIGKASPKQDPHITHTAPHTTETLRKHIKHHQLYRNNTETSPRHRQNISETPPRQNQNKTETSPKTSRWHHSDTTETSLRHHRDISQALQKQDRDINMTPAKQHSRGHRNIIATSARHQQSITKTRPRHHRDTPRHHPSNAKPRLTHHRDTAETCPRAWIFESWSYAHRCTVYKNWNLRFCLETHHHQKIETPSPKQKKQHCNINDITPSYHPFIIKTSEHHHHTSRRLHRIFPIRHQHITERSQNTIKKPTKQHQNNPETSQKKTETETWPRHQRDIAKTTPRQDRDKTKKGPRQDRDITETRKHHRSTYGYSYTDLPKGAQYTNSNWNLKFCLKTRSKCLSVFITKKSNTITKAKKQHCNIKDKTPSHHPLIIINVAAPSPYITEISPKHARDVPNDQCITERSPKHHPKTNTTTPKQQLDITKKRQRQDRDILAEFFSCACAAPGRPIHIRPQAHRFWGIKG